MLDFEFLPLKSFEHVKNMIEEVNCIVSSEKVSLLEVAGRILSQDIFSGCEYPPFSRATVDGWAVKAKHTFGATPNSPIYLKVIGEIPMGERPKFSIQDSSACKIHTGGILPEGSDAVLMHEFTEEFGELIEVKKAVGVGENVIRKGSDLREGMLIFPTGHRLKPKDLGILAALGINEINVYRRIKVAIIATGDELISLDEQIQQGKIRNSNTYMLSAALAQAGFIPYDLGIVRDDPQLLANAIEKALEFDVVLITGGSSVGSRDYLFSVLCKYADILVHGIAMRPGKPTIIAKHNSKFIIGLPGHPTSCMVVFEVIIKPLLYKIQGHNYKHTLMRAICGEDIPSCAGRVDFVRVKLEGRRVFPLQAQSGLLMPLVYADGLLIIPQEKEGVVEGEEVDILLM